MFEIQTIFICVFVTKYHLYITRNLLQIGTFKCIVYKNIFIFFFVSMKSKNNFSCSFEY